MHQGGRYNPERGVPHLTILELRFLSHQRWGGLGETGSELVNNLKEQALQSGNIQRGITEVLD
jgi:hypothetical protein